MVLLWIGIAGICGVFSRYIIHGAMSRAYPDFPFSTLLINLLGSLLIGVAWVLLSERSWGTEELRQAVLIGFLGSFTTFSTYSLDGLRLLEQQSYLAGTSYIVLSPILGLTLAWSGVLLTRAVIT